jgi:DnaA regulatory inactivator Hda
MSQFILPLSLPPVYTAENFYVSACNEQAHGQVLRWPGWLSHALVVFGENGTGKTHLGRIWAQRAQADVMEAANLHQFTPRAGNLLLEDIERAPSQPALLHLFNDMREKGHFLLMTSAVAPAALPFDLPDLTSRLRGASCVSIAAPNDEMLAAALRKQFADRQLKVDDEVVDYLLPRMERSLAGVHALVDALDKHALTQQRSLTIPFVRRCLESGS